MQLSSRDNLSTLVRYLLQFSELLAIDDFVQTPADLAKTENDEEKNQNRWPAKLAVTIRRKNP